MHMLYNSDSFVVVQFEVPTGGHGADASVPGLTRGGYEIVDKRLRKEIFISGAMAESFKQGVQALAENNPSVEQLDDYIAGYTQLAQHPVVLH